jgi:hypothetical protein
MKRACRKNGFDVNEQRVPVMWLLQPEPASDPSHSVQGALAFPYPHSSQAPAAAMSMLF